MTNQEITRFGTARLLLEIFDLVQETGSPVPIQIGNNVIFEARVQKPPLNNRGDDFLLLVGISPQKQSEFATILPGYHTFGISVFSDVITKRKLSQLTYPL